jgi:hypothetical protein
MKFTVFISLLAVASAFTTRSPAVGGIQKNVVSDSSAHRNRRATIVMDGKANGEKSVVVGGLAVATTPSHHHPLRAYRHDQVHEVIVISPYDEVTVQEASQSAPLLLNDVRDGWR